MTDEKGVGSLPDAGTIQPGDPGHIETHDEMARLMQVAADSLGIILDPPAPKPAVIGEYGHVDAHNTLLANIEQLAAAGGGGLPGELPGLGGWAEITAVSGSPKRYAYNDGGTDWVAFEWTGDGSVTTTAGLAVTLLVGGGAGHHNIGLNVKGNAGDVVHGIHQISTGSVTVGQAGRSLNAFGGASSIGSLKTRQAAWGRAHSYSYNPDVGFESGITGVTRKYAGDRQHANYTSVAGDGTSSATSDDAQNGIVIVRVPAAQAAGVDPGSWVTRIDYYAEVTDGLVTDLYQEKFYGDDSVRTENGRYASPEQPDDLIPCDPMVAEGWTYDGKDFTPPPPPPPPSREELIAELQARIDELTKDKK